MGRELELQWPSHPVYPPYGYVVRRRELDIMVAHNAVAAGCDVAAKATRRCNRSSIEASFVAPWCSLRSASRSRSAPATSWSPTVPTADSGVRSVRSAPASGRTARRFAPTGETPRHAEPWIESALDVKDRNGNPMPGYGWIFPVGDGTVNIGVGLLSTFRDFKSVNTTHLLDAYAHQVAERWEINPDHPECKATSGRIPMGGSVGPKAGPTYLVVGDAAGAVNPFNGEGIDYAYETARMAAMVLHEALDAGDPTVLQRYPSMLDEEYGEYFKVARLFARVIGRPALMRELHAGRHAQPHLDGMGPADHGQPVAPRRARPSRVGLQGCRQVGQTGPQRLAHATFVALNTLNVSAAPEFCRGPAVSSSGVRRGGRPMRPGRPVRH